MKSPVLLRSLALLTLFAAPAANAAVCRVAPDGGGNGATWSSPMSLQGALSNDNCTEVWVRKGLYKPVVPANPNNPSSDERKVSLAIRPGVRVYGGFAGTESLRDMRDPQAHRSVLSGDLDNDDTTDADGIAVDTDGVRGGNSFHVVTFDGGTARGAVTRGTVLDGVVITSGRANGSSTDRFNAGGGLFCSAISTGQECSPTLRDVWFSGNYATDGGAMYLLGVSGGISRPLLNRVRASGNRATSDGGGLYNNGSNAGNVKPELIDVEFIGNRGNSGGAVYNRGRQGNSSPVLDRVGFSGNTATYGGAIYNDATNSGIARAHIGNATFHGNTASSQGGAIYNDVGGTGDGRMTLVHATFSGNSAARGGAIYNSGGQNNTDNAGETLLGVILWGNTATQDGAEIFNSNAAPIVRDSIVAGGCPTGAQCSDLSTANPALGALADNGGFSRTMLPNTGSAAINTAASSSCPLTDQRAVPRAQGIRCDIGAVEVEAPACYVKHDASGSNNGSSWANAYKSLQSALASANCGEIRVAKGVYTPTDGTDVSVSFDIRPGQRVYGGFNGTEVTLEQRDPATHRTVLSGDIGHDDVTDADGIVVEGADRRGSNSQRVVKMDGTTAAGNIGANTVLDGFAITAAAGWDKDGGGLLCDGHGAGHECSPTLRNLLFSANHADMGGGLCNYADGGRANPTLINITFRNNSASYSGGGLYNRAWNGGDSSPALTNVTFVGSGRGAMSNDGSYSGRSSPLLNHVTFHANADGWNAASMLNSGSFGGESEPILTNVILWGGALSAPSECGSDGHVEICNQSATPTIRASLIAGGCPAGAICAPDVQDLDPRLAALANNGGVGPTLMPAMDSPAVDAGADDVCAETDQRGVSRPQGPRCDIGAVEAINDRIFANGFD